MFGSIHYVNLTLTSKENFNKMKQGHWLVINFISSVDAANTYVHICIFRCP